MRKVRWFNMKSFIACAVTGFFVFFPTIGGFGFRGLSNMNMLETILILYAAPVLFCGLAGTFILYKLKAGEERPRPLLYGFLFSLLIYGALRASIQLLYFLAFLIILHPLPFFDFLLELLSFPGLLLNELLNSMLGPAEWLQGHASRVNQLRLFLLLAVSFLTWGLIGMALSSVRRRARYNESYRLKYFIPCAVAGVPVFFAAEEALDIKGLSNAGLPLLYLSTAIFAVLGGVTGSVLITKLQELNRKGTTGYLARGFLWGMVLSGGIVALISILDLALYCLPFYRAEAITELVLTPVLFPGLLFNTYVLNPLVGYPLILEGFASLGNELRIWLLLSVSLLSWGAAGAVMGFLIEYIKNGSRGAVEK